MFYVLPKALLQFLTFVLSTVPRVIDRKKKNRENVVYADYKEFFPLEMSFEKMYLFTRLSRVEPRAKIRGWSRGRTPHPVPPGTKKLRSAVLK